MLKGLSEAPLKAAFFCAAILAGCNTDQPPTQTTSKQCPALTTPIANIQGNTTQSPLRGQQVTVKGIVTLAEPGHGLYVEEPRSDMDAATSNAIFIETTDWPVAVKTGSVISTRGEVSEVGDERNSLTAITHIDELILCTPAKQALPLTEVVFPLNSSGREALEGMRIAINSLMTVTDVYRFKHGKITLSGNGFQFVPTEVVGPGQEAAKLLSQNRAFSLPALFTKATDQPGLLVSGTSIGSITGVLAHDGYDLRVSLQSVSPAAPASFVPPSAPATNTTRVVGMNLHNYFNGDGQGQGFPTPRGAETLDEFQRQRDRIGAAIQILAPHLIAVMELENDGFGAYSAAQDFIQLANTATGKTWAVARPIDDNTGDDAITVAVFYRSDWLKAIGAAHTLTGAEFERSRQPIAQVFQQLPDGETILVVINHLKSKGSCPDSGENADQKDGQGCWNPMRSAAAEKMSAWATGLAASTGTDNILILGDMNAYRKEDPVDAIRHAGFIELMDQDEEQPYSFAFYGQHGTLDYAFSSRPLLDKVQQAFIWDVNATLPSDMDLPRPWLRFSDHDPVVVDLSLRHSNTSD